MKKLCTILKSYCVNGLVTILVVITTGSPLIGRISLYDGFGLFSKFSISSHRTANLFTVLIWRFVKKMLPFFRPMREPPVIHTYVLYYYYIIPAPYDVFAMAPIEAKIYQCKMWFWGLETRNLGNSLLPMFEPLRLKIRQCRCITLHISKWRQCVICITTFYILYIHHCSSCSVVTNSDYSELFAVFYRRNNAHEKNILIWNQQTIMSRNFV